MRRIDIPGAAEINLSTATSPVTETTNSTSSRREFLSGKALRERIAHSGEILADALCDAGDARRTPTAGSTVRLATNAMACEFSVVMNPGPPEQVMIASDALELIHPLEEQLTVYRETSELSRINRRARDESVPVERELFQLLLRARAFSRATGGCFDVTTGPLIALWRLCKRAGRIPEPSEIEATLAQTGIEYVVFDEAARTVRFTRPGMQLNLGAIGKGYALDRAAACLIESGFEDWLFHGGHSSILARGDHNGLAGWPIGIRNPLFTEARLATVLLKDRGMSTSGSNIQFFRHNGRRYGHILDPRSGMPAEALLSATVLAPTAEEAEALSTAFFVLGVEKSLHYCDNHPQVAAILIPHPRGGRRLEPVIRGLGDGELFFEGANSE